MQFKEHDDCGLNRRNRRATDRLLERIQQHHAPPAPVGILCYPVIPAGTEEQVRRHAITHIQGVVARHFSLTREELISQRRTDDVARPRQIAMYLALKRTGIGTVTIGRLFGDRDHTTVIHAARRIKELTALDSVLRARVEQIDAELA